MTVSLPSHPGRVPSQATANLVAATELIDELARCGVQHACLSPGSRSAPMAVALAHETRIRTWILTDERSAGFFALGIARETRRPVLLLCTSGTAAANYTPAMAEAFLASVPLIAITADRPPELRDCGAAQTISQNGLFTNHVVWEAELPPPSSGENRTSYYRTIACRAFATADGNPAGPVHLNLPLREPLVETVEASTPSDAGGESGRHDGSPWVRVHAGRLEPDPRAIQSLVTLVTTTTRGAIVCGPDAANPETAQEIVTFAEHLGWPILADPVSGLRHGAHSRRAIADAYDVVLRDEELAQRLTPEALLRVGGMPSSKPLQRLITRVDGSRQVALSKDQRWRDPLFCAGQMLTGDVGNLLQRARKELQVRTDQEWLGTWQAASQAGRRAIQSALDNMHEPFEGHIARAVLEGAPHGAMVLVGNSTPIRDIDTFHPGTENLVVLGNRGANGIDGMISCLLGAAAVASRPVIGMIGDLSYLHDIGALQIATLHELSACLVVVNNGGGQIFSRLPYGEMPEAVRSHFTTPHELQMSETTNARGVRVRRVEDPAALEVEVRRSAETKGLDILEVVVSGDRSAELHAHCLRTAVGETVRRIGEHF